MGYLLTASCKCGFERKFNFGAGMLNFQSMAKVPAIIKNSKRFVIANYNNPSTHKRYLFYNNSKLNQNADGHSYQWGEIKLIKEGNFCPGCSEFVMVFRMRGLFD
jgi:hypothetical protein